MESLIAAVVTALAGVLTRLGLDSRPNRLRREIEHSLVVIEKARAVRVPTDVVTDLEAVLTAQASRLRALELKQTDRRLDWGGFIVGLFFTAAAAIGGWSLISQLSAWYWTTLGIIVGLFALVLLGASISALVSGPRKKS